MLSKQLLSRGWQQSIARNLPIWHSELSCRLPLTAHTFKQFGLPIFFQLRIHHGTHCDFYSPMDNKLNNYQLYSAGLLKQYSRTSFVSSLRKKYKNILDELLRLATNLDSKTSSLNSFFNYYGRATLTLDITAAGSKVVTDHLISLLNGNPAALDIIEYYGRQRGLSPMQNLNLEINKLKKKEYNLEKEAMRLYKKYYWIPANFVGDVWCLDDFKRMLTDSSSQHSDVASPRPNVFVPPTIKYWARCLGEIAYLNEFRKSYFTRVNVLIRPVLQKIAEDNNLGGWAEMNLLKVDEIIDLVKGKNKYQKEIIDERKLQPIAIYNKDYKKIGWLDRREVKEFEKKFALDSKAKETRGTVANRGKVQGESKVILTPSDFGKMSKGNILVAKMTSTDFIPIMKLAGAFVTDEGGLSCHAAIVAREMGVPCIIGTKNATKIFKDGDMVEVDADNGVVRKIK